MTELMALGAAFCRRLLLLLFIVAAIGNSGALSQQAAEDWTQFGWDLALSLIHI